MIMEDNAANIRFYIFLAIMTSPIIVFKMGVINATVLYLLIPNSRNRPFLHYLWTTAIEVTEIIMKYIVEIADLFTLYTYALVISDVKADAFPYFESILGLQLSFMLNKFLLNGFSVDLEGIARTKSVSLKLLFIPLPFEVLYFNLFNLKCIKLAASLR
ncbi:uncharacterized protein TNCT_241441 [Trichonephila clavata]|uniref:Uncharacterized protein n=1 Tax=Trichonephila clavata TaxID=2740835 RepID=A0A8X6H390_TRICU|nr:uncharacterized protein TNCT_241441 [Trichonephila clavata]